MPQLPGLAIPEIVLSPIRSVSAISDSLGRLYVGCGMYYLRRDSRGMLRPSLIVLSVKLLAVPMAVFVLFSRFLPQEGGAGADAHLRLSRYDYLLYHSQPV